MQLTMFHGMPRQQLLLLLGLAATGGMDAARVRGDSSLNAGANMKPAMTVKGQHNSAVHNSLAKLLDEGLKSPGGGDGDDAAALLIHELMSKSGGSSSPQSMEDMIPQLLPILQGMENSTKRQHAAAQNHINSVHGHFELCHPSSNSSLSTYWSTYQSTLSSHTTCRGSEFTLENGYTSCTVRKSNLKTEMDDKKTLYDDVNGDPTPTPDCQSPTSEGRGDYLLRLKNFFNSTYTEWSTRKQNWVTAKTAYEQVTCNNEQTSFTNKKAECDRDLRTIESNACSYAQGVKTACDSYDTCWTDAEAAYNEAKQATQEQEAAFKVHWRGVQRMKCVLKALGNGSATTADASVLEACIGVTLYDTSHLDVTYPAVPAKDSCDDPTEYPCSAAYVTAVYQSLQPNTPPNVPVCNACVLPGLQASNTFTYDETAGVKTEGWSSALTTNTGDGLVHGPFAGNTVLTKTFTLPDHESVTLTLRYWSLDSWDMEKGYVKVDGAEVWSKVRESCLDCVGWQSFGGQFPNPWLNDNQKCYEDVEIVRPHSATQLTLTIGSNTDQDAKDEAWAVDRITLVVQATVAVTPTVQVCPEGYEQLGKIGDDVPGWGMSTGGNTASDVYRCAAQCTANDACGAFEFKEDFPNACALNSFADASTQAQTGTWTGALTCKKVLGPRANECWDACGARRGYCDKCPSAGGKRGACCMNGDENDPAECQRVPRSDFPHAGYHECVLVPEACRDLSGAWSTSPGAPVLLTQSGCSGQDSNGKWKYKVRGDVVIVNDRTFGTGSIVESEDAVTITWSRYPYPYVMLKAECRSTPVPFDHGWGRCETYAPSGINHPFCSTDEAGGLRAEQVCLECGKCRVATARPACSFENYDDLVCTSGFCGTWMAVGCGMGIYQSWIMRVQHGELTAADGVGYLESVGGSLFSIGEQVFSVPTVMRWKYSMTGVLARTLQVRVNGKVVWKRNGAQGWRWDTTSSNPGITSWWEGSVVVCGLAKIAFDAEYHRPGRSGIAIDTITFEKSPLACIPEPPVNETALDPEKVRYSHKRFTDCGVTEIIRSIDECAKAARAVGMPSPTPAELEGTQHVGCRIEAARLVFRSVPTAHSFEDCTVASQCLCHETVFVFLTHALHHNTGPLPPPERPEFQSVRRCRADKNVCEQVVPLDVWLQYPLTKVLVETAFECTPATPLHVTIAWARGARKIKLEEPFLPAAPSVRWAVNGEEKTGVFATSNWRVDFTVWPSGTVIRISNEITIDDKEEWSLRLEEFSIRTSASYMLCEDNKACLRELKHETALRYNNSLQLQCLRGEFESPVCTNWLECLNGSDALAGMELLLGATVAEPEADEEAPCNTSKPQLFGACPNLFGELASLGSMSGLSANAMTEICDAGTCKAALDGLTVGCSYDSQVAPIANLPVLCGEDLKACPVMGQRHDALFVLAVLGCPSTLKMTFGGLAEPEDVRSELCVAGVCSNVLEKLKDTCDGNAVAEEFLASLPSCDEANGHDCKLADWSEWGPCSSACGGFTERTRNVIEGSAKCPRPYSVERLEYQRCNMQLCGPGLNCTAKQDLIIALDASGSLKEDGFETLRSFAANLTQKYKAMYLGSEAIRMGLVLFGNGKLSTQPDGTTTISPAMPMQPLTADIDLVTRKVMEQTWQKGLANMAQALIAADVMLAQGGRQEAQSAILVLSDGRYTFKYQTAEKAQELKDKNIMLYMAPVMDNEDKDLDALQKWVSQPWETHYERIPGLARLKRDFDLFAQKLIVKLCPHSVSPARQKRHEPVISTMLIRKEAALAEGAGAALARAGDKDDCIDPGTMDTEAWYCLCIDAMQKACHDVKKMQIKKQAAGQTPDIQHYDETKCLQAMGCYDPFNLVCASWKNDRRRCMKLRVYRDAIHEHQKVSLVQRANHSASGAAGGGTRLDATVASKAHQCSH